MQNNSESRDATPQAQSQRDERFSRLAGTAAGSPEEAEAQLNLAKAFIEHGRYDESIAPLDRAISLSPYEALFYLMKADALIFLRRNYEALSTASYALALSRASRADCLVPSLLVKGQAERAIGKLSDALATYAEALSLSPDNASVLVSRGAVLHDMSRLQEALADFDEAKAQSPHDPMAWYDRGNVLKDLNRYDEALDSYRRATSLNPQFALAWNNAATLLYHQGRYADAVDCAENATCSNPHLDNSWYVKGRALLALQRREEARTAFDQAIALDRDYLPSVQTLLASNGTVPHPQPYSSVGGEAGNPSMPNGSLGLVASREPSEPESFQPAEQVPAHVASATPSDELQLLDHVAAINMAYATAQYAAADPVNPVDPAGWYMKSLALYRLGRFQEALTADDLGLHCSARDLQLWNMRGLILHALDRDSEALPCFDYAIALDPGSALAYNNQATIYLIQGDVLSATPRLEQATRLDPSNAYGWSNFGYALYALQKPDLAFRAFERAISLSPHTAAIYNNQGTALRALGRIDEALVCYDQALSIDGTFSMALRNRARALQAAGRDAEGEVVQSHLAPPESGDT